MGKIDRKSSIESEPRTLNTSQMQHARDVAQYVMNTASIQEAFTIFTKGLKPVSTIEEQNRSTMRDNDNEEVLDFLDCELHVSSPRDIASAPF